MQNEYRHLAAILFTDIVGFTSMMQHNEGLAVTIIKRHNLIMHAATAAHGGEVLNFYGDGCLCIFPSATEAMYCALEVQKELQIHPVVPLRIGLHIGEVFFEEGKVLGDGVNVASRIQSLGRENNILFSGEIRDKIKNHPNFKSISLGSFSFKNVDERMEVFALANEGLQVPKREEMTGKLEDTGSKKTIFGGIRRNAPLIISLLLILTALFLFYRFQNFNAFTGREKSIAVLPFVNIGNDPKQEYFSDGITEEITTRLSKISDLKVISRSTAMLYKNSKKPLKQIAQEMGAASILEGSIRKSGDEIRITAQLIDANTQQHIWAEQYNHRNLLDIFSIQSEVAQQIAQELNARLSKEEKIRLETKPTANPEAYDLFLKGRYAYNLSTLEGFHSAETFFQEAIKKDPHFKLAHSHLANVYSSLIVWAGDLPPSVGARKAMSVLNKSLGNDTLYIDFTTLAFIEFFANKNFAKAEHYFKRAIGSNSNDELSFIVCSLLYTILDRKDEALAQLDKARMISPVNPFEIQQRAEVYYANGEYGTAAKVYLEGMQVFPEVIAMYDGLGRVYATEGEYLQAISILRKGLTFTTLRPPSTLAFMANAHFKMNDRKKSGELVQELKDRANKGEKGINFFIALYYSAIKKKEEAFHYLDQALNTNDVDLIWLKHERSFSSLRNDPRFDAYLKQVGF